MSTARFFMPEVRQGTGGSKKRYAGPLGDGAAARLEFVGLEAVRRDWTPLARRFQRELLDRVFHDRPVDDFVRDFLAALRAGELRRPARVQEGRPKVSRRLHQDDARAREGRPQADRAAAPHHRIRHDRRSAPSPSDEPRGALDYEHYVEKQLEPIADAVLRFLGLHFADLVGRPRQLELW